MRALPAFHIALFLCLGAASWPARADAPPAPSQRFEARAEDATLNGMLERWGAQEGWRRRGERSAPDIDFRRWRGEALSDEQRQRSRMILNAALAGAGDFPAAAERLFSIIRQDPALGREYPAPTLCLWSASRVFTLQPRGGCGEPQSERP